MKGQKSLYAFRSSDPARCGAGSQGHSVGGYPGRHSRHRHMSCCRGECSSRTCPLCTWHNIAPPWWLEGGHTKCVRWSVLPVRPNSMRCSRRRRAQRCPEVRFNYIYSAVVDGFLIRSPLAGTTAAGTSPAAEPVSESPGSPFECVCATQRYQPPRLRPANCCSLCASALNRIDPI